MKRLLSLVIILSLLLTLTACISEEMSNITDNLSTSTSTQQESNSMAEDTSSGVEWKQFLKEYENWADDYIELTKKYKNNPSDLSLLSDYTKMMSELTDWSSKTEALQKDLEKASSSELVQYSAELSRIAAKIAKVAY